MSKTIYVTFGQSPTHKYEIDEKVIDHNCVVKIVRENGEEVARAIKEFFGIKYAFTYTEEDIQDSLRYYPRGIIEL